jgi:hypothetical protein
MRNGYFAVSKVSCVSKGKHLQMDERLKACGAQDACLNRGVPRVLHLLERGTGTQGEQKMSWCLPSGNCNSRTS